MKRDQKEQVVDELTQRLKAADTLVVRACRGLRMPQIDELRTRLLESGARFQVVKNTLTRRAAEAAGADALLTLLDGPSAIAFLEADGDMLAAAARRRGVGRGGGGCRGATRGQGRARPTPTSSVIWDAGGEESEGDGAVT